MRWLIPCVVFPLFFLQPMHLTGQPPKKWHNPNIADADALAPEEQVKKFHLPPGFVIELVAAEPKIKKPINIAFDAAGRLWVTGSEEYPYPAPGDRKPKDTVKILEDFAPNGLARKVTTFADGLNIPIGVLPTAHGAIVYSIPSIYQFTDTTGKGVADKREVLYTGYGYKDTHGMTGEFAWGPDGWIYCCHGYANASKVVTKKKDSLGFVSGNTYRIKPDGSRIEHFTFGQVNPFGLAFDPLGNLYSCDCHSRPIYQLLKGAHYPTFGKPSEGLGLGPETINHDHGSTAIAGIIYYAAEQFPKEYRDNIFIGNVVTNRINRDRLERHGSTYKGIAMDDFVKCDDPWFRPVDIKLGPDGALYVADFYNRIIGHYEVALDHPGRDREKGRIWRISYKGPDGSNPLQPWRDLTKATVAELVQELGNINLAVRTHATNELVQRGDAAVSEVQKILPTGNAFQQAHGLWVLERLGKLDDAALTRNAQNGDPLVRTHAMKLLAEKEKLSKEQRSLVLVGLKDADAFVQRAAAEALGSHPAVNNLAPLLECRYQVPAEDTHLLHVVRMALRDQLKPAEAWPQINEHNWNEKEARALADVCVGVRNAESAGFLLTFVGQYAEPANELARFGHYIARYGKEGSAQSLLAITRDKFAKDFAGQGNVLKAVQQGLQEAGKNLGAAELEWAEQLTKNLLTSGNVGQVQTGIDLAGSLKLAGVQGVVFAHVTAGNLPDNERKNAIAALFAIEPKKYISAFAQLLTDPKEKVELREQVANSLAQTNHPEAHAVLVKALLPAPARLQTSIALALAGSSQGGEKLLEAVTEGKASARLLQEKAIDLRLHQSRLPNLDQRLAKLTKGLAPADERLQKLINERRSGFGSAKADAVLGAKVFEKHCAACHQLSNKGAKIGPQLDGIGIRGLDRLLEDILDPNRNVDQAFRATTLVLNNGQLVTGLLLRQEGEVLIMADAQGKEVRVPGNTVQERLTAQLSPMPANLSEQIPAEDFYHLLGYLLEQRVKN